MADCRRRHGRLSREPKMHVVTMATFAIVTMAILPPDIIFYDTNQNISYEARHCT
jgi:hypothetical protein